MKVMTVTGPLDADQMGVTMPHEHLILDGHELGGDFFVPMDDIYLTIDEIQYLTQAGCQTLVDQTPIGLGRNPQALRQISEQTGLNVIMGTGWYRKEAHPAYIERLSTNDLADILIREFNEGVDNTGIRPGIIGEIATGKDYISPGEERVLRASARAQMQVGVAITTHTAFGLVGLPQIEILSDEAVNLERVVIGHADSMPHHLDYQEEMAKKGVYLSYDCIGKNAIYPDHVRVSLVLEMVKRGYIDQILISSDVCFRGDFHASGGIGYDHVLNKFVPMLRDAGITSKQIDIIMIDNPKRAFAI